MAKELDLNDQGLSVKGGNKKKIIIIVALVVVIAVLAGVIVYLLIPKEEERRNKVVTRDNIDEVLEQMTSAERTAPGYYTVTMNNNWTFEYGGSVSEDAIVENSVMNTSDVYFDVFLEGDEENPIYESPVIPVGATLDQIALDTVLDAGTYDCIVIYHMLDENENTTGTLRVKITITVQN